MVPPKKFKNDVDEGKYETVDISKYSKEDNDANKEEEDLNIPDIGNDEELYKDPNGRRKAIRVTTSSTKASSPKAKAKQTKSKNDNFKDMEGSF